jgi:hypothetical protein
MTKPRSRAPFHTAALGRLAIASKSLRLGLRYDCNAECREARSSLCEAQSRRGEAVGNTVGREAPGWTAYALPERRNERERMSQTARQ